jgi:hypothetical protein
MQATSLNFSQYRTLINLGSDTRALIEVMNSNNISTDSLINSINNNYIAVDEIISDCFIWHNGNLYDQDNYVILEDTGEICHIDDANFCERDHCHVSEISEVHIGREGRDITEYWATETAEEYSTLIGGEYYKDPTDYNFVHMYNDEWEHIDNVYYWESDGEYHYDPEEEEEEEKYTSDYHSSNGGLIEFSQNPKFFIGIEIEKEDKEIKESISISDFKNLCPGWRKERDGSLDSEKGYELITPTMELNVKKIQDHIKGNEVLIKHINAAKSLSCGGHINVSEKGKSGNELFENIKGYTPLFYALYFKRVDKNYCKGKKNKDLQEDNEKYQAVKIHDNRVEYRIVSAVPNLDTLIWRVKLMDLILKNQTGDLKQAFFKITTGPFKKHIQKMYPGEKYNTLVNRIIEMCNKFEDIKINE